MCRLVFTSARALLFSVCNCFAHSTAHDTISPRSAQVLTRRQAHRRTCAAVQPSASRREDRTPEGHAAPGSRRARSRQPCPDARPARPRPAQRASRAAPWMNAPTGAPSPADVRSRPAVGVSPGRSNADRRPARTWRPSAAARADRAGSGAQIAPGTRRARSRQPCPDARPARPRPAQAAPGTRPRYLPRALRRLTFARYRAAFARSPGVIASTIARKSASRSFSAFSPFATSGNADTTRRNALSLSW